MIVIATSSKDPAGLTIKKQILHLYNFDETMEIFQDNPIFVTEIDQKKVKLVTLRIESVHAQDLSSFFPEAELIVFISKHSSESGTPTLSVHTPGNLGEAKFGGISRVVSVSPANAMKNILQSMTRLKEERQLNYEVSYECTHHGPSLNVPVLFAELGSSPKQWNDLSAAEVVAHSTMEAVSRSYCFPAKAVVGIGGPHYNYKFTKIALNSEVAFGHIIPKHAISYVDVEILKQCVEKTLEKVESVFLDWKGIRGMHKPKLTAMLKNVSVPFQRV